MIVCKNLEKCQSFFRGLLTHKNYVDLDFVLFHLGPNLMNLKWLPSSVQILITDLNPYLLSNVLSVVKI